MMTKKTYYRVPKLLEKETLEEFRFLLNYRFDSMSPMAVVLVGQKRFTLCMGE